MPTPDRKPLAPCPQPGDTAVDHSEPPLAEWFSILVTCTSENEQRELYEQLTAAGHTCRVLTL